MPSSAFRLDVIIRVLGSLGAFVVLATAGWSAARADEGMWTFDNFPAQKVADAYGFRPDQAWLDNVRLSSVRLAQGCSGSFVSANGLVMTNHHCAQECISEMSTSAKDYNRDGFYAARLADERKCPAFEINQLIKIEDVTDRIQTAERGLAEAASNQARKGEIARITGACDKTLRCDVVTLYAGGQYKLYTYRPYRDVRLVWAPEFDIAYFGGDPDNFTFPRYDLDIALMRVYENNKPLATPNHFGWNAAGPKNGDLAFVTGNPGRTERLDTVAQLEFERDVTYPFFLRLQSDFDGYITRYATESVAHKRQTVDDILFIENDLKVFIGRQQALLDPSFLETKQKQEDQFRAALAADPAKQVKYGAAWSNIAGALDLYRHIPYPTYYFKVEALDNCSNVLSFAETLVRAADELPKPNDQRLPEFADARLASLQDELFSSAPIFAEYEKAKLHVVFHETASKPHSR